MNAEAVFDDSKNAKVVFDGLGTEVVFENGIIAVVTFTVPSTALASARAAEDAARRAESFATNIDVVEENIIFDVGGESNA